MSTECRPPRPGSVWIHCRCPKHAPMAARLRKMHHVGLVAVRGRDQAWVRLREWHRLGYTPRVVHDMTGLGIATIKRLYDAIRNGEDVRIQQTTATAILRSDGVPNGGGRVPSIGASRRMRALALMGWSASALVDRTGIPNKTIQQLRRDGHPTITVATDRAVREAYDALWGAVGPSLRARNYAKAHGWHGPLAWDDDTIDDPAAEPYTETRPTGARAATETAAEVADYLGHVDPYATASHLAQRLGYRDVTGVQIALKRADRPDLLAQLARNAHIASNVTGRTA